MPISIWCILIAAIMPIVAIFPAKLDKSYDNSKPRDPDYWSDGFRARASAAAANSFEALPFFAAAVIVGLWQGGSVDWINKLAVLFIGLRVIYILCYYTDRATPRSISWLAALLSAVAIFTSPIWSV